LIFIAQGGTVRKFASGADIWQYWDDCMNNTQCDMKFGEDSTSDLEQRQTWKKDEQVG
jgi:hypothetical protein